MLKRLSVILFLSLVSYAGQSQILISLLLFGDKLNSSSVAFGLEGGLTFTLKYYYGFTNVYKGIDGRKNSTLIFGLMCP